MHTRTDGQESAEEGEEREEALKSEAERSHKLNKKYLKERGGQTEPDGSGSCALGRSRKKHAAETRLRDTTIRMSRSDTRE